MEKQGFYVYSLVIHPDNLAHDFIFVHKTIKPEFITQNVTKTTISNEEIPDFPYIDGQ